jgi:fumarylpyruvate hydrolase
MSADYLFPPRPVPVATIEGVDAKFPVHRIFCVGRNYLAHAAEMGFEVDKTIEEPLYFLKDAGNLVASGEEIRYPPGTENYHHEMEFVVAIGKAGFEVSEENAGDLIYGYACGLDMTRRDLQLKAREKGRPWDLGKNFEQSAVLSAIVPKTRTGTIDAGTIELSVNGETRQSSDLSLLIWNVPEVIAHLSKFYHLQPGDLIYTGTPAGVGSVVAGDRLHGSIEGVGEISLTIAEKSS